MNATVAVGFAPIGLLEITLAVGFDHLYLAPAPGQARRVNELV
jgi:hypothetical protein